MAVYGPTKLYFLRRNVFWLNNHRGFVMSDIKHFESRANRMNGCRSSSTAVPRFSGRRINIRSIKPRRADEV